jgi:MFS family permease
MGFLFTALVTSLAGFASALAPNYIWLVLLRFIVGVGLGGGHVLASWFIEFIPAPNRGTWMIVFSFFWTVGTIFQAAVAWVWSLFSKFISDDSSSYHPIQSEVICLSCMIHRFNFKLKVK